MWQIFLSTTLSILFISMRVRTIELSSALFTHLVSQYNLLQYKTFHSSCRFPALTKSKTRYGWLNSDSTNTIHMFCLPNRNWKWESKTGCAFDFVKCLYSSGFYFYLRIPILRLPTSWRTWKFGQIDCNQIFSSLQTTRNHMLPYNITLVWTTTRL